MPICRSFPDEDVPRPELFTGAGPCAYRSADLEAALGASLTPDAVDTVEIQYDRFNSDLHASAEYRANLVRVMARRAVEDLLTVG